MLLVASAVIEINQTQFVDWACKYLDDIFFRFPIQYDNIP